MFMVMVMMLMLVLVGFLAESVEFGGKRLLLLHGLQNLSACELVPVCGYDGRMIIVLADDVHALLQLIVAETFCMAEYHRARVLDLILIELTEIGHVHLAKFCVDDCSKTVQFKFFDSRVLNCDYYVAELAYA